jgi:hypothetical protein
MQGEYLIPHGKQETNKIESQKTFGNKDEIALIEDQEN